jgi:type IV pilus assembly protein PilW
MMPVKKMQSRQRLNQNMPKQMMFGKQKGLSIVELLVAMAVGLILTLGISQIFTSNSKTMKLQNELARVQEDSRIAIELISRAVRNADYWGCAGSLSNDLMVNHLNVTDTTLYGFEKGVEGFNDNDDATDDVKDGTDVLVLRGSNSMNSMAPDAYNPTSAIMFVKGNEKNLIKDGDIVAISDCGAGDIFQATNQ